MRRSSNKIDDSVAFKRNGKLPPAVWDSVLESCESTLVFLPYPAFINKERRANIFLAVQKLNFLGKMAWVCEAYHYSKEKGTEGKDGGFL